MQADIVERLRDTAERVGEEYCVNAGEGWVWPCYIMRGAAAEIVRLRKEMDEMRRTQPYIYIGKDGKAILARVLEDQRDELREALDAANRRADDARAKAIEEAAQVADGRARKIRALGNIYSAIISTMFAQTADAIRALQSRET